MKGVNEKGKGKFSIIQYSLRLQMYLALVCSDIFRLSNLKCYKACGLHALTSDTELNKKRSGEKVCSSGIYVRVLANSSCSNVHISLDSMLVYCN